MAGGFKFSDNSGKTVRHLNQMLSVAIDRSQTSRILGAVERAIGSASIGMFLEELHDNWWDQNLTETFANEGKTGGTGNFGGWQQLAPATQRIREQQGYDGDGPINVRDGALFEALLNSHDLTRQVNGGVLTIPGTGLDPITQTKLETAQQGRTDNAMGLGPTPPRPILGLTVNDAAQILSLLNTHIMVQVAGGIL